MYAMQYELTLPADHDMGALRERVGAAMHTLDDRPGLGLKAYLFRDKGIDGSPVNQYACFYLWHDTAMMADLLFTESGRFQNVIAYFGRPTVRHWTGITTVAGPARGSEPETATRRITPIPADRDLAGEIEREIADLETLAGDHDVHTAALAVDPYQWRLVRFVLRADTTPRDGEDNYRVLHVSTPGSTESPIDRNW